jgi:hypothetical protein
MVTSQDLQVIIPFQGLDDFQEVIHQLLAREEPRRSRDKLEIVGLTITVVLGPSNVECSLAVALAHAAEAESAPLSLAVDAVAEPSEDIPGIGALPISRSSLMRRPVEPSAFPSRICRAGDRKFSC